MDHLRSEEEQVAALKKWWSDNGTSLLVGLGLALAAIFGWKAWQNHSLQQKAEASAIYQQLSQTAASEEMNATLPEAEDESGLAESNVSYLAEQLQDNHGGSKYAAYSKLFQAKTLVGQGEFEQAESILKEAREEIESPAMQNIVELRLARVLAAQEKYDEALGRLEVSQDDSFYAISQELKGDILQIKGDTAAAREAYANAHRAALALNQPSQMLKLKLDDLAAVE